MGEASLKRPLRRTAGLSCVQPFAAPWTAGRRLLCPRNSARRNTGEGCHALLQGMPPTQESNSGLLNCKRILCCLSHKGNPRILEWVAYPFSRDLPDPGSEPGSPALQADSLPAELPGKRSQNPISCLIPAIWHSGKGKTMKIVVVRSSVGER